MSATNEELMRTDLAASAVMCGTCTEAQMQFQRHLQHGEFELAEDARLMAVASLEGALDALARAYRRLANLGTG